MKSRERFGGRLTAVITCAVALAALGLAVVMNRHGSLILANAGSSSTQRVLTTSVLPVTCTLPVRTDKGPGLLSFPTGAFSQAGVSAQRGRAYSATTGQWLPTEPAGVSTDEQRLATLDSTKGGTSTLQLLDRKGNVLFTRPRVRSIVGWAAGELYITTSDTDQLLRISTDGRSTTAVTTAGFPGDAWYVAAKDAIWGMAPDPGDKQTHALAVIRFDINSQLVSVWSRLQPDSTGSTSGSIVGLTSTGKPIVADLSDRSRPTIRIVTAQRTATQIYPGGGRTDAALRPLHAMGDAHGIWLTTVDGELYASAGGLTTLQRINVPGGQHVYAFGGPCN